MDSRVEEDGRLKRVGQKREGGGGLDRVGPRVGGELDRVGPRREEGGRRKRVGQIGEGVEGLENWIEWAREGRRVEG